MLAVSFCEMHNNHMVREEFFMHFVLKLTNKQLQNLIDLLNDKDNIQMICVSCNQNTNMARKVPRICAFYLENTYDIINV